jgi:hypothetical protein
MRCVTFNLFHLSSIQQGIQGGHAANAVRNKYPRRSDVKTWAHRDLTIIHKNGGDCHGLQEIVDLFKRRDNKFAWAEFREPDMENCRTSVAIVLPERISRGEVKTEFEEQLRILLKSTKLAI